MKAGAVTQSHVSPKCPQGGWHCRQFQTLLLSLLGMGAQQARGCRIHPGCAEPTGKAPRSSVGDHCALRFMARFTSQCGQESARGRGAWWRPLDERHSPGPLPRPRQRLCSGAAPGPNIAVRPRPAASSSVPPEITCSSTQMPPWLQGSCSQVSFILLQKLEEPSCPFELSGHSQPSLAAANGTPELWAPGRRADNGCGASPPQGFSLSSQGISLCKDCTAITGFNTPCPWSQGQNDPRCVLGALQGSSLAAPSS